MGHFAYKFNHFIRAYIEKYFSAHKMGHVTPLHNKVFAKLNICNFAAVEISL